MKYEYADLADALDHADKLNVIAGRMVFKVYGKDDGWELRRVILRNTAYRKFIRKLRQDFHAEYGFWPS